MRFTDRVERQCQRYLTALTEASVQAQGNSKWGRALVSWTDWLYGNRIAYQPELQDVAVQTVPQQAEALLSGWGIRGGISEGTA